MLKLPSFLRPRFEIVGSTGIDSHQALALESNFVDEPGETIEGLEFIIRHEGMLALRDRRTGCIEAITEFVNLDVLLNADVELPPKSPLAMVIENNEKTGILSAVLRNYPGRAAYYYLHGTAAQTKRRGYGTRLVVERSKRLSSGDTIQFAFLLATPPNIPSLKMVLGQGAIVDKFEQQAYENGVPYFRIVYDERMSTRVDRIRALSQDCPWSISLERANYIREVERCLNAGYVGTRFESPSTIVFQRRL